MVKHHCHMNCFTYFSLNKYTATVAVFLISFITFVFIIRSEISQVLAYGTGIEL